MQLKIEETMASDEVQQKIMAATEQASAGAVQIRSLKQQLDQYNVFYMGLNSYTAGVDQAAAGARQLQSNMPALLDGVKQLRDGAMQLSDGLKQFNEEGVEKLVSVLGDDVEGLAERLTATVEVSRNYRSFSRADGRHGRRCALHLPHRGRGKGRVIPFPYRVRRRQPIGLPPLVSGGHCLPRHPLRRRKSPPLAGFCAFLEAHPHPPRTQRRWAAYNGLSLGKGEAWWSIHIPWRWRETPMWEKAPYSTA